MFSTKSKSAHFQIAIFSETALVVLISIVTLLLQLISFATTWNGSRIYLEGVFPHASLLFAIAVQATAYFFSNSLRTKIRPLKVIALCTALCCSTYYSYIGIYNSVNSPASYLQDNYTRISHELTQLFEEELEKNISSVRAEVGAATASVTTYYSSLSTRQQQLNACREALGEAAPSYSSGLRPPSPSSFAHYEDYAAAYQTYINSATQGSNAENAASRDAVLGSFGFTSIEQLSVAEGEVFAELCALENTLFSAVASEEASVLSTLSTLGLRLERAIDAASLGQPFDSEATADLHRLFQVAALCNYNGTSPAKLLSTLKLCADSTASDFMCDYTALVQTLPEGKLTAANTMDLKAAMDCELLSAILQLNSLLPENKQLSFSNEAYRITDLYLIPIQALRSTNTRITAFFCLAVAALIDALSVLFAISLRDKKPLWRKRSLLLCSPEDYTPYIYATLPAEVSPATALADFMSYFAPSPRTEADGYMLQTGMEALPDYNALTALLCQLNLAKIVPEGFLGNSSQLLLLKARFVLWANSIIYEERRDTL